MSARPMRAAPLALVLALVAVAAPVRAAEPSIAVEPGVTLPTTSQEITVHGTGFDPAANGGVGIYLVFGPRVPAPTYYTDALLYIAARWLHPGAAEGATGQAPLAADGSFTVTMTIEPRFVDGHDNEVDCLAVECVLLTMAAHGVDDRTQDTFTTITFSGEPAASGSIEVPQVSVAPMSAAPAPSPSADAGASEPTAGWLIPAGAVVAVLAGAGVVIAAVRRRRRTAA